MTHIPSEELVYFYREGNIFDELIAISYIIAGYNVDLIRDEMGYRDVPTFQRAPGYIMKIRKT